MCKVFKFQMEKSQILLIISFKNIIFSFLTIFMCYKRSMYSFFIDFNCSLTVDMHTSFRIIIDKKWRKRKQGKNKDSYITSVRSQFNLYVPDHLMYLIYIKKLKIDYNSYLAVFDQQNDITPNFQKIRSNSIPVDFSKKRRKIITHTFILKDQSVCTCLKIWTIIS